MGQGIEDSSGRQRKGWLAGGLLVAYVLADLSLRRIALAGSDVIPWYPGAGIALAFLVLMGPAWTPVLLAARLLLYAWPHPSASVAQLPPGLALAEAMLQLAAYAAAAAVIRARVVEGLVAWRTRHAAWLIAAIGLAASVAGLVSGLRAMWVRSLPLSATLREAVQFGSADAAGALIVLPAVLLASRHLLGPSLGAWSGLGRTERVSSRDVASPDAFAVSGTSGGERLGEIVAVLVAVAIGGLLLAREPALLYLRVVALLPLAWVAIREGVEGAAWVLAAYGAACLGFAIAGGMTPAHGQEMQSVLLTLGIVGLLLGAARTESAESSARYWHLLSTAGEGVWRVDANGRTLYLNERMAAMFGLPASELIGREVRELIAPEDLARWDEERRRRAGGEDSAYETQIVRADGTRVRVLVRGSVVRSTAGTPVGSVAIVTDISDLRLAESERNRAQVLLEAAFRSSRDAMILFRADDERIVDVNEGWCAVTGYTRDEVIGRSQKELRIWGDPADSQRLAEAIREHGEVHDFEIAFNAHRADGVPERGYALLSAYPVELEGVTYYLVTGRDITADRRRDEGERRIRRLEELGRLAGSVSHDFNNLLTVVLAYAQLARASVTAGEPVTLADLDEIEHAAARGQELTRRLLAFSRNQVVEPKVVDLADVVEQAQGMLRTLLGPIALHVERGAEPLPVLADPAQVDQVLLNLAVNARDATPDDGTLTVVTGRVHAAPGEAADVVGPGALPGDYAMLRVHDTGAGMDEATQAHIFEPFFTTKAAGKGTGLGLAVVFGIVRQARGAIRVESTPGEGTTFTLYWPVASLAPLPSPPPAASGEPMRAVAPGRILVVEDEATVRRIVRRVLEDAGYEVHTAEDGERALQCIDEMEAAGTPPDVVLSDVIMPRLGGRGLAERLAARSPGLPMILMSGHAGTGDVRDGLRNVPVPVVTKPFDVAELLATVARVMARTHAAARA